MNTLQHQSSSYQDGLEVIPPQRLEVHQGLEPYLASSFQPEKPDNRIETLSYQNTSRHIDEVLGLRKRNFWLLLALISLIVIGVSVGGSVGGALTAKNNSKTSVISSSEPSSASRLSTSSTISSEGTSTETIPSTTLIASTTTTPSAIPTVTPTTDCPGSDLETYSPSVGSSNFTFKKYCTIKFSGGTNILEARVSTFDDCISICASYNYWQGTSDCQAVGYNVPGFSSGDCWIAKGDLAQNGTAREGSNWAILV